MEIKSLQILYEHLLNDRDHVRSMIPGLSLAAADPKSAAIRRTALAALSAAEILLQELAAVITAFRDNIQHLS